MGADVLIIGGGPGSFNRKQVLKICHFSTKGPVGEWKAGYTNIFLANVDEIKKQESFSLPLIDNLYSCGRNSIKTC
ncbi:hypothetical protein J6TS2_27510 [Heyndrickxia sporothermodurans]|nr:hypothetical protein J6TS2_27510 [Heyndrickxia sporothermodurans]